MKVSPDHVVKTCFYSYATNDFDYEFSNLMNILYPVTKWEVYIADDYYHKMHSSVYDIPYKTTRLVVMSGL